MGNKTTSLTIYELVKSKNYPFALPSNSGNSKAFDFDLELINIIPSIIEKISCIANNPITILNETKEEKRVETVLRIDNSNLKETMVRGKYWREKDNEVLPEYVFSSEFDANYATYENRFIITLINKLFLFVNLQLKHIYSRILSIKKNYQGKNDYFTSLSEISKLSNIAFIKYGIGKSVKKKSFLTMENPQYIDALKSLLEIRKNLNNICLTAFFKNVMKSKPLTEGSIFPTNILLEDRLYSPCYSFYIKLIKKITEEKEKEKIDSDFYFNYVGYALLKSLFKLGFKFKNKKIYLIKNLLSLDKIKCFNKEFKININSKKNQIILAINLKLKNKTFIKSNNLANKLTNKISLEVDADTSMSLTPEIIDSKISRKLLKGFDNAFIVTQNDKNTSDDLIYCSPYDNRIDRNILNMLKSMMLITEGDPFVYSNLCPICSTPISLEEKKGVYNCPMCGSSYSIIKTKVRKHIFHTIWIKRLKSNQII